VLPFRWSHPTRVVFGEGVLAQLGDLVNEVAGSHARVLLLTGQRSLERSGVLGRVLSLLGPNRVRRFSDIPAFPSPATAKAAVGACRDAQADVVVAVGGGSVLDVAKVAALLARSDVSVEELINHERSVSEPALPILAAPTTSGSSSEVTPFAALWDAGVRRWYGVSDPRIFPTVALVDPVLTATMPKELAALSGADAMTSAFESYWSTEANPISDALNLEVISLFATSLEASCLEGDRQARSACALAATLSGMAYTHSRPNVCHAVGRPLTLHWGTGHGQAVGVTLPAFLDWNAPAIKDKVPALLRALGTSDLSASLALLDRLFSRIGIATRLGALGVRAVDIRSLVENLAWERTKVLPRPLSPEEADDIFSALL